MGARDAFTFGRLRTRPGAVVPPVLWGRVVTGPVSVAVALTTHGAAVTPGGPRAPGSV